MTSLMKMLMTKRKGRVWSPAAKQQLRRDENDVTDSTARDDQQDETERPNTAASRDSQNPNDTPNLLENEDVTSEMTNIRKSPNMGEVIAVPGL